MFKKLMASVGIGAAKVDTLVHAETVRPGSELPVTVQITAGDVEQTINGLTLAFMTRAEVETDEGEHHESICLGSYEIDRSFELEPGEVLEEHLTLIVPEETPVTELPTNKNKTRVWLQTGLDIAMGLDGSDKDALAITPTPMIGKLIDAMDELGLRLRSADVEKGRLSAREFESSVDCYQELEFKPTALSLRLKEVEISCIPQGDVTHVMLEVDRTFRGDGLVSFTLPNHLTQGEVTRHLEQALF